MPLASGPLIPGKLRDSQACATFQPGSTRRGGGEGDGGEGMWWGGGGSNICDFGKGHVHAIKCLSLQKGSLLVLVRS